MKRLAAILVLLCSFSLAPTVQASTTHELLPWKTGSDFLVKDVTSCGKYIFLWTIAGDERSQKFTGFVLKGSDGRPGIIARKEGMRIRAIPNGSKPYVVPRSSSGPSDPGGYTIYLPQSEYNNFRDHCTRTLMERMM